MMANSSQTRVREEMTTSTVTTTVTEPISQVAETPPVAVLKLRRPRTDKKVEWTNDTVDNENMNKKKSKCCCIYEKKKEFGGSDSDDSGDECDNCSGHVDRKKHHPAPAPDSSNPAPQPSVS